MTDPILQALQETDDPQEKAAIVAEAIFALLSTEAALAARRSVILHWFDQAIVEALLEDRELTLAEMSNVYEQLLTLPFIDTIPSGLTFQNLTREGLIKQYSLSQPDLLQTAARLAAPHFEIREEDKKSGMEAFFCYLVAGEQEASKVLLNTFFDETSRHQDWQRLDSLFQLQEEAERLPFVQPIPRDERHYLLRGLIHRVQGNRVAALLDYKNALTINPRSTLAYTSRGTTYAELGRFGEALVDYNTALRLDKKFAQAYLGRGITYTKQGKYTEALKENDKAIQLGLRNAIVFLNKGDILIELGQYEDAVVAYDAALRLDTSSIGAYIGKGQAFNGLERYNDALAILEEALRLDLESVNAHISKGQALHGLERYSEALSAFEDAIRLNRNSAEAYRGKGRALSRLGRYGEASEAFEQANKLDLPQKDVADVTVDNEDVDEVRNKPQQRRRAVATNEGSMTFLGSTLTRSFREEDENAFFVHYHPYSAQRGSHPFWNEVSNSFAVLVVCIIIVISALIFHPPVRDCKRIR